MQESPTAGPRVLWLAALGLILPGLGCGPPAERPPNFVVIFIDDLGYGDIGPFGATRNRTPHLDRMASEGLKLTSFYVAAPVCTPSRAALMTGSYPKRVGLATGPEMGVLYPGEAWGLHADELTIAEILQERGYATGCFGKWHLGDQPAFLPTAHGFDEYFGIPYSNDMWPWHRRAGEGGVYAFPPLPLVRGERVIGTVDDMQDQAQLCKSFTDEAVGFIRRNQGRPFFVYLPHAFVHHPRSARDAFLLEAGERPADSRREAVTVGSGPWYCGAGAECGPGEESRAAWAALIQRRTQAQIEEVDWSVGEILGTLRELDLAENTLVVFTSDNGGAFGCVNDPLRGGKGSAWEGGMRVPTLAWWPGQIPSGAATDELATTMDLLPTFAGLSGGGPPSDRTIDGRDISSLLLGGPAAVSPHSAFFYYRHHELEAVRSGRWKLFRDSGALYDLDADVGEKRDVADRHPETVSRLKGYLADAAADLGDGVDECPGCRPVGTVDAPRPLVPRSAPE